MFVHENILYSLITRLPSKPACEQVATRHDSIYSVENHVLYNTLYVGSLGNFRLRRFELIFTDF